MNFKENYLYFAESVVETGNTAAAGAKAARDGGVPGCDPEGVLLPVRSYLGLDIGTNAIAYRFESANARDEITQVVLTCEEVDYKEVIFAMSKIMNSYPHSSGFIVVADSETASGTEYHSLLRGKVTGVSIIDSYVCGS